MLRYSGLLRRAATITAGAGLTVGTVLAAPVFAGENAPAPAGNTHADTVLAPAGPDTQRAGSSNPQPIVGGHQATEAPSYITALYRGDGSFTCTASLVSAHWVLTAEHCTSQGLTVRVGSLQRESGGETAQVTEIVREPSGSDVALLRIGKDIKAEYPDLGEPGDATTGTSERVYGWGYTQSNWTDLAENLKYSEGEIYDASCDVLGASLCIHNDGDTAGGDSGGPMLTTGGSETELIGTCTAGHKPTDDTGFGAYTDITKYRDWIDQTISQ